MSSVRARPAEDFVARILHLAGKPGALYHPPRLILTVGLPGSGKSTFCHRLARASSVVVLESDAVRQALYGRPTHDKEESRHLFTAIREAARVLLDQGAAVVIDATSLSERDRAPFYAIADEAGAVLTVLHFQAPDAVVRERLTRRGFHADAEDLSTAGIAVHERLADTEQPISRPHLRIDTSDEEATRGALDQVLAELASDVRYDTSSVAGGKLATTGGSHS